MAEQLWKKKQQQQLGMDYAAERSRKRAQQWSKGKAVVIHLAVCFVFGAFAPLVTTRGPSIDSIHASSLGGVQRASPPAAPDIGLLLIVTVTRTDDDGMSQEAALTRLGHTLRLVPPPLVWIVVGAENTTASTVQVLRGTGVMFRHLTYAAAAENTTTTNIIGDANATNTTGNNAANNTTRDANATNTTAAKDMATNTTAVKNMATNTTAVENMATNTTTANSTMGGAGDEADQQRNMALSHIERHRLAGVVHFASASAIYDLRFFEELRQTRGVAAWPTATVSSADQRVTVHGPTCNSSQIAGWYSKNSDTNETRTEPEAAAQDTGAIRNSSSSPPDIGISGLGFRSPILWESERFINSNNSSSGSSSRDFIQLVRQMAVGDERMGIPSDCSESRIMMWHLGMPKYTPEVEEHEAPQEQNQLEEDEEDYMT